jgi:hypothetical protein
VGSDPPLSEDAALNPVSNRPRSRGSLTKSNFRNGLASKSSLAFHQAKCGQSIKLLVKGAFALEDAWARKSGPLNAPKKEGPAALFLSELVSIPEAVQDRAGIWGSRPGALLQLRGRKGTSSSITLSSLDARVRRPRKGQHIGSDDCAASSTNSTSTVSNASGSREYLPRSSGPAGPHPALPDRLEHLT